MLAFCDSGTPVGQRDYAILLLLALLGLRAGEVVALTLDDPDWERGEIVVRGKGQRLGRLPLPTDVGAALVDYLRHVRPTCSTRRVFIRMRAPLRCLVGPTAIDCVVHGAHPFQTFDTMQTIFENRAIPDCRLTPVPIPSQTDAEGLFCIKLLGGFACPTQPFPSASYVRPAIAWWDGDR
jgi:hypothetical protein